MGPLHLVAALSLVLLFFSTPASAQLRPNYYANSCPLVENIVRNAVMKNAQQNFGTIPAIIRLFFHDCFVSGCDASILVTSTESNTAERDHPDNLPLAQDGFDTINKAKAAVEARCPGTVSCADILALATREAIVTAGGPSYPVRLGRKDGSSSTAASVDGNLPHPTFNLNQLNTMFAKHGLTQMDMIALSGAHTIGSSHCGAFSNRVYNSSSPGGVDPTIDSAYANELKAKCPKNVDPKKTIHMDPNTPRAFDNVYYKNLQSRKGLFTSDQVLSDDIRSKPIVITFAANPAAFMSAFTMAMNKLGEVGVITGGNGNIRHDCTVLG